MWVVELFNVMTNLFFSLVVTRHLGTEKKSSAGLILGAGYIGSGFISSTHR